MLSLQDSIENIGTKKLFSILYGKNSKTINEQMDRYQTLIANYETCFSINDNFQLFSTPGRTEIGGNHTDHNHGRVLAAGINLDTIAAAAKNNDNRITIYSQGYDKPFIVTLDELNFKEEEKGTTNALIRGIAARFVEMDYKIGGFNACISSNILAGSGLSSSASIEVLIGTILNVFYNEHKISEKILALIGQYAENVYFKKPCGLMDQIVCAVGGIVIIDFKNPGEPLIKKVDFTFSAQNYSLIIVNTGGNHADLTDDYASVPREMIAVAEALKASVCREITMADVLKNISELRSAVGDRAVLRAIHFLGENERVENQVNALEKGDFEIFLKLVNDSGNSSFKWLQNCYTTKNTSEQGITLALSLTEDYIKLCKKGACRVHGGGFAGTIQVFLPSEFVADYKKIMESVFGKQSVLMLNIRQYGTLHINDTIDYV